MRDYSDRFERLVERRTAPVASPIRKSMVEAGYEELDVFRASPTNEIYNQIEQEGKATRYAVGAMEPVDENYTRITYEEGRRIEKQLEKAFAKCGIECEYKYQGSVPCDLHIKAHSDIDMLAITRRFWSLEPPLKPSYPYKGEPTEDLREIRRETAECLDCAFPTADVDSSGPKSVSIEGGSLRRKVDIVPANWLDTKRYAQTKLERDRAIQILNDETGERIKNLPFLHIDRVDQRDRRVFGGMRKVARLMKSLKYDSDNHVTLSSYDIAGIAYAMPDSSLIAPREFQLQLLYRLKQFLDQLADNEPLRDSLMVPDQTRKVFYNGHANLDRLEAMQDEVDDLVQAVAMDLNRSFDNLAEARISFKTRTPVATPHFNPLRTRSSL